MDGKRKPSRNRKSMTVTLSQSGIDFIKRYAMKHNDNRSEAIDAIIDRYRCLLLLARPASLSRDQFRTLAQLADGIIFSTNAVPKAELMSQISTRLGELAEFEDNVRQRTLSYNPPAKRLEIVQKLNDERSYLMDLQEVVKQLTELQSMVIIEAIEEIYSSYENLESRCTEIFRKLWPVKYDDLSF